MLNRTASAGAVATGAADQDQGKRVMPRSIRRGPPPIAVWPPAVLRRAEPSIDVAISAIRQKVIEDRKPMTRAFGMARAWDAGNGGAT
jgi:hypothetical protein